MENGNRLPVTCSCELESQGAYMFISGRYMVSWREWKFIVFHFCLPNDSVLLIPLFKEDFESGTSFIFLYCCILGNLRYSEVGWKAYIQSSD